MTQFVSHVCPASPENACSHFGAPPRVQRKRQSTLRPSASSSPKNVPVFPSNLPTIGGQSTPGRIVSAQWIAHSPVDGSESEPDDSGGDVVPFRRER